MKKFVLYALCALFICVADAQRNKKKLGHRNVYVQVLQTPETFTPSEWSAILANITDFKLDSYPTGTKKIPKEAGKIKKGQEIISSHIIGGVDASRGQFPWQVAVKINNAYFCGGSLIHPNWVLTAAHCTSGFTSFSMTFGGFNLSASESGRVVRTSTEKYVHQNYSTYNIANDVGVIKIATALVVTSFINVIRLPRVADATQSFAGVIATASGWGRTYDGGSTSSTLKYVNVPVITNDECIQSFGTKYVIATTLCTSGTGTKGTCNGDSGGPLVYKEADGLWTQIGSVSYGATKCVDIYPSAYARLSSFLGWISNTTQIAIRRA